MTEGDLIILDVPGAVCPAIYLGNALCLIIAIETGIMSCLVVSKRKILEARRLG